MASNKLHELGTTRLRLVLLKKASKKYHCEHTLFTKLKEEGKLLIVSLYVDDLIFTMNDNNMCEEFKKMMLEFDMSDLGKIRYFLGIEVL